MHNRYFTADMLAVITEPAHWSLISSFFPPDIPAEEHPRHAAWMIDHSHAHANHEIMMTLSGGGLQGFRGQVYPRRPGSVFYFNTFEPHDFYTPPWAKDEVQLWISLLPLHVIMWAFVIRAGVSSTQDHWRLVFPRQQIGAADKTLADAESSLALPPELSRLYINSFLGSCLCMAMHAGYDPEQSQEHGSMQQQIIKAIQHHIEETAGRGVTIDHLAHIAGYSKYHLLRLFKHYTGRSIHGYINECRLHRTHQLQSLGRSQKEIAVVLGFSCPSAFAHWFKHFREDAAEE